MAYIQTIVSNRLRGSDSAYYKGWSHTPIRKRWWETRTSRTKYFKKNKPSIGLGTERCLSCIEGSKNVTPRNYNRGWVSQTDMRTGDVFPTLSCPRGGFVCLVWGCCVVLCCSLFCWDGVLLALVGLHLLVSLPLLLKGWNYRRVPCHPAWKVFWTKVFNKPFKCVL